MFSERKTLEEIVAQCPPVRFLPEGDRGTLSVHLWPIGERIDLEKIENAVAPSGQKKLAVCFGGLMGLTIAAAVNADAVLMLDANPFQVEMYKQVIFPLIDKCETSAEFKEAL